MKPYANLHTHSTHSDGQYTPAELAAVAKAEGYRALAITDHDTATAFPELKDACAREGLECIFAVEFSVREPIPCHVVGFDFDPEYPPMKEYLIKMGARETDNTKCCFDEAISNGNIQGITWDEVLEYNRGIIWLCNNHVFRAMKAKGLVEDSQYIEWFYTNFDGPGAKYPPLYDFKTLPEIVDMIKKAGGFAVCAHPSKHILDNIDVLLDAGRDWRFFTTICQRKNKCWHTKFVWKRGYTYPEAAITTVCAAVYTTHTHRKKHSNPATTISSRFR